MIYIYNMIYIYIYIYKFCKLAGNDFTSCVFNSARFTSKQTQTYCLISVPLAFTRTVLRRKVFASRPRDHIYEQKPFVNTQYY